MMSPVFSYLLESSICLGVLYMFYHIVLRDLPSFQWNRVYLLATYVVALTLPILNFNVYPVYIENTIQQVLTKAPDVDVSIHEVAEYGLTDFLIWIYLFVTTVFLGRLIFNLSQTFIKIYRAPKIHKPQYTLIESNEDNKVYSFFRYLIKPYGEELLPEIIEHELVHIKQHHSIDLIISEIVKSIFWFNPFAYICQKAIKINHEYLCDDQASKNIGRYDYALILHNVSYSQSHLTHVNNFSFKLKNRIIMLQKLDSLRENKWRYALVLPILLFGMHSFAFNTYPVIIESSNVVKNNVDTIPQVKHVYRVDTTTIFDYETYEETVEISKTIIGDTIMVFDPDTYTETISIIPRNNDCYVILWGNRAFGGGNTNVSPAEIRKLFRNKSIKITPIQKECDKVTSWSGRITIVPTEADPRVQGISMTNSKVKEDLIKGAGYLNPGTKILLDKFIVNGDIELSMVLTVE